MTTLPNTGIVLPTRGAPGSGLWADAIDAALTLIDALDHTPGKGARIPTAGLNINADLTFSGLYAPTNLNRITFSSVAALSSNNKSLFVNTSDNELYWRSNSGSNVKITSGAALNVAAFTGGIAGDYTAVGAQVAFDDAGDRYTFKQNGATGWARLASGDVRLFETGTSETVFVGLAAPSALAASYTVTMPLAAPGSTSLVQMDSGGVLTASNTVANAVTLSSSLSVGTTLGVTGASTQAAITASGLITANAGMTAGANQHVTVSGTGKLKYGTLVLSIPGWSFQNDTGSAGNIYSSTLGCVFSGPGASASVFAGISLPVGARVTAVRAFIKDNATGSTTVTAAFLSLTSGAVATTIASSSASAGSGANQTLTISPSATTLASSTGYAVRLTASAANNCNVYCCEVDYDQP